ncbi:MAG: hypothetical protein DYH13_08125 [Alphaproteobacteria bacterium PRO2]|nr:hypothetical protein [Alphaproteobacteria bacterium PRO2]
MRKSRIWWKRLLGIPDVEIKPIQLLRERNPDIKDEVYKVFQSDEKYFVLFMFYPHTKVNDNLICINEDGQILWRIKNTSTCPVQSFNPNTMEVFLQGGPILILNDNGEVIKIHEHK